VHGHTACPRTPSGRRLELADVVRAHGEALRHSRVLSPEQRAALRAIEQCRTAVLGGHLDVCSACGHERPSYNSCRNRHCPKCQALAQARWIDKRLERLLPVRYFHVVFTLPSELRDVAMRHREAVFDLLFASASQTLLALANDPKRLGAQLGVTMVLHTWTRDLRFHPHIHAIVTGGGLTDDAQRWIRSRPDFLFPVQVMGALFRGKMLDALQRAHDRHGLYLEGVDRDALYKTRWVVYAKRPFGGPEHVIRYLGRYTHRVGISNQRMVAMDERGVTFRTKNGMCCTLSGQDLLARFIQHVLPARFVKIRHYGLHAARHATTRLEIARQRLTPATRPRERGELRAGHDDWRTRMLQLSGLDVRICPACNQPTLERRALPIPQSRAPPEAA
jgi:Putative transposase/Transposase zinc-binding domain